ncbi:hypothetical protein [Variovorax gossypii]
MENSLDGMLRCGTQAEAAGNCRRAFLRREFNPARDRRLQQPQRQNATGAAAEAANQVIF